MKFDIPIPNQNKNFDVVGLGLNAIDHLVVLPRFPEENTKNRLNSHELQGGGQMGSGLTALARLGAKTRYLGKVGDDWQGNLALQLFEKEGIDVTSVRKVPDTANLFSYILVNESNGSRTILTCHQETLKLQPGDFSKDSVLSGKIFFIDGSGEECTLQCATWAKEEKIPIVMDVERMKPYLPEMMELADCVITSENFANQVYPGLSPENFLKTLGKTYQLPFCGITLGDRGSLGYAHNQFFPTPAFPVKVTDTTGAGDVYHGAFIYGLLEGWDIKQTLRFASAAAALKCQHLGGRKGAPDRQQVQTFLASHQDTPHN